MDSAHRSGPDHQTELVLWIQTNTTDLRDHTSEQEAKAKVRSGYIERRAQITGPLAKATEHERFGVLVAGFEGADIVTAPGGLTVFGDGFVEAIAVPFGSGGGRRATVFDELYSAVTGGPSIHDGRWGRSTLSVCLAALESSTSGREVTPAV